MLSTLRQLSLKKTGRITKIKKDQTKALAGAPYKAGVIIRCYTTTPKKPNSAIRKVAKVRLWTGRKVIVGIPGMGHDLRSNTPVIIRGGRLNDVPGVRYKIVRGKLGADTKENIVRKNARSKYHLSKTGRPRNK